MTYYDTPLFEDQRWTLNTLRRMVKTGHKRDHQMVAKFTET